MKLKKLAKIIDPEQIITISESGSFNKAATAIGTTSINTALKLYGKRKVKGILASNYDLKIEIESEG